MKKGTPNSHQSAADELADGKPNPQISSNQYLERLKDLVSKKRKLKALKQKRNTLLAQLKFLKRRRYLLKDSEKFLSRG